MAVFLHVVAFGRGLLEKKRIVWSSVSLIVMDNTPNGKIKFSG